MAQKTSWGAVAGWYDEMLSDSDDSYQKNVILPNLIRLVDPKNSQTILDVACGQGYFTKAFASSMSDIDVIGCDISPELIELAKKEPTNSSSANSPKFQVSPADNIPFMKNESADTITIVLAIQNIENLAGTFAECSRILKPSGRLLVVLNHPAFRIPQNSSWQWDENESKQYRRIDAYMSDHSTKIDMTPGEADQYKKKFTVSFHRPLQSYFKALNKAGLSVARLEEWISHRKSQKGPRGAEEDRTRKEIPMFLCLECHKIL
jgi:ubiquinone/menaquinone biosynthesis C-methylase UbiE